MARFHTHDRDLLNADVRHELGVLRSRWQLGTMTIRELVSELREQANAIEAADRELKKRAAIVCGNGFETRLRNVGGGASGGIWQR